MGARIAPNLSCVHCKTTETPLWRAGPAGPKTLCNACGVRWKKTGSVIPRAKRPSAPTSSSTPSGSAPTPILRKRARTSSTPTPSSPSSTPRSTSNPPFHSNPQHDPAARVAAASLPAPRPVSVFRVADAARSKYDSVFSGLMVVNRARDPSASITSTHIDSGSNAIGNPDPQGDDRPRTRTHVLQAHQRLQLQQLQQLRDEIVPPSPSPPPMEKADCAAVYVTEVHAPSPSPSPPPMPKVQRLAEGGGFRLLLAAMAKDSKPTT